MMAASRVLRGGVPMLPEAFTLAADPARISRISAASLLRAHPCHRNLLFSPECRADFYTQCCFYNSPFLIRQQDVLTTQAITFPRIGGSKHGGSLGGPRIRIRAVEVRGPVAVQGVPLLVVEPRVGKCGWAVPTSTASPTKSS